MSSHVIFSTSEKFGSGELLAHRPGPGRLHQQDHLEIPTVLTVRKEVKAKKRECKTDQNNKR